MKKDKIFTLKEIAEIKILWEAGELVGKIAKKFKIRSKYITVLCLKLGFSTLKRKQYYLSQVEQDKIIELFNKGFGATKISKIINISERVIFRYYKLLGLHRTSWVKFNKKKNLTQQDILDIIELYKNKISLRKISELFKTDHVRIRKICRDAGLIIATGRTIILSKKILGQIKKMFDNGSFIKEISQKLNLTRHIIRKAYKILGIDATKRRSIGPRVIAPKERKCRICNEIKPIDEFESFKKKNGITQVLYVCKKDFKAEKKRKRQTPEAKNKRKKWHKKKYDTNIGFKLASIMSVIVRKGLKNNNSSKNGKKMSEYLDYNMEQLSVHIENSWSWFENLDENGNVYMSWENYGIYDPNRKTWHIDHFIPQSCLLYSSVDDEMFKFCWSLINLRAYSAEQNIKDGATRIRHKAFIWLMYCLMAQCYLVEIGLLC